MKLEIREPQEEELDSLAFIVAYSFDADRSAAGLERVRQLPRLMSPIAAYREGEMVACLGVIPFAMFINGAALPLGGVSAVACLPEHRRQGYVGELLRQALARMRQQGQILSALYTPHYPLYRRFGWMVALRTLRYSFAPKDVALASQLSPHGKGQRVTEEDWPRLDAIYNRLAAQRNGYLQRSEIWWREAVFRELYEPRRDPLDAAVWLNDDGEWRGYVAYRTRARREVGSQLRVRDFVALDADAYLGLVRYVLQHDLATEVIWEAPTDDPFLSLVDDPARVRLQPAGSMMLRVVDLAQALARRPCLLDRPPACLVLEVHDGAAPWNQGVWRLEAEQGQVAVKKGNEPPHLSVDASVLAALFNGFLSATEAARAGLLTVHREEALTAADRIFAASGRPSCTDSF